MKTKEEEFSSYRFIYLLGNSIFRKQNLLKYVKTEEDHEKLLDQAMKMCQVLIRRTIEAAQDKGLDVTRKRDEAPGPIVDVFFCCYCGGEANGRWVFMGRNEKIVANPFCDAHEITIYDRTHVTLRTIHGEDSVHSGFCALQTWSRGTPPPPLPRDQIELIRQGASSVGYGV